MMRAIRSGRFNPDKPEEVGEETQYWEKVGNGGLTPTQEVEQEVPEGDGCEQDEADKEDTDEEESEAADSEDEREETLKDVLEASSKAMMGTFEGAQRYQFKDKGKIHFASSTHVGKLACNRWKNEHLLPVVGEDFHQEDQFCKDCIKALSKLQSRETTKEFEEEPERMELSAGDQTELAASQRLEEAFFELAPGFD